MIARISGQLEKKLSQSVLVAVGGLQYEVIVPSSVLQRLDEAVNDQGQIDLVVFHYIQIGPSKGYPVLIGFLSEVERDFFEEFISVSGIGPRAAVKALNRPISEIALAVDKGDFAFLKSLPGIGLQKAKDIIAKLQGKVGKYVLIQDAESSAHDKKGITEDWQEEALEVLLQLQYKRQEAKDMIQKALKRDSQIDTAEQLLNEIYKQRIG